MTARELSMGRGGGAEAGTAQGGGPEAGTGRGGGAEASTARGGGAEASTARGGGAGAGTGRGGGAEASTGRGGGAEASTGRGGGAEAGTGRGGGAEAGTGRPAARLARPLARVFADPMLRNGHALIFSAGVTQVIGVLYWAVAARNYPAAVVGRNSAAISITLFLAGIAELNLMSTLVRFLPTGGTRSVRLILTAYAASTAVATALGAGFLLLIPSVEPQLDFLRSEPFLVVWFVVSVITGAIFVLQDSALTGVRAAPFVPLENATFSVLKLVMMVVLVGVVPASGIYVSWTAGFALAVIPTNIYLFARAIPRHLRRAPGQAPPPPRKADIRSYFVIDSLAGFSCWLPRRCCP